MDIERIILTLMVIVLHYNNRAMGGALNYAMTGDGKEFFVRFSESLCICAVDAFLMASGYFSVKRDVIRVPYKKAIWLLAVCSFYRTAGYLIYALGVTHEFSLRTLAAYIIPSNWFVVMFVTVLLLSPFIVKMLSELETKAFRELIAVMVILFGLIPTVTLLGGDLAGVDLSGFATITINGDVDGFNITAFVLCYCLGFFLRREQSLIAKVPAWCWGLIYVLAAVLMSLISYRSEVVWSYSGIFCVLEAFALTAAFAALKKKDPDTDAAKQPKGGHARGGRIVSALSGCSLGIFIWHTMPLMIFGYWVHLDIASIADGNLGGYLLNFLAAVLSMYVLSAVWVLACRTVVNLVKSKIIKRGFDF